MASAPAPVIVDELIHQDDELQTATPASESATSALPENTNLSVDPSGAVGVWVRLITKTDDTVEGLIYAYDTILGALVLQCLSSEGVDTSTPPEPVPESSTPPPGASPVTKPNGKPMSFAAAAAAAASRSTSSSPTPSKKPSASPSPASNGSPAPASGSSRFDFHIIKLNHIKDLEPLARLGDEERDSETGRKTTQQNNVPRPLPSLVPVGQVQIDKAIAREQATVGRIGVGVSSVAQNVFDNLSKTLPTRWAKDAIIIMDEIEIVSPYTPNDCRVLAGKGNAETSLARVKKVVEGVRTRLGL